MGRMNGNTLLKAAIQKTPQGRRNVERPERRCMTKAGGGGGCLYN
jgi:hypothetical protein